MGSAPYFVFFMSSVISELKFLVLIGILLMTVLSGVVKHFTSEPTDDEHRNDEGDGLSKRNDQGDNP